MKQIKSTVAIFLLISCTSYGQRSLSVTVPTIWSNVKVKDNWTPATAPNSEEYKEGSAFGYGIGLNYTFQPSFIIKDKHFTTNIGAGYFKQRFEIKRPFDYNSPVEPIFYTDHYSYHCWQGSLGITYNYELKRKYVLSGNLTYSMQYSFQQNYTPTYSVGTNFFTQVNHNQIDFGRLLILNVGLNKYFGKKMSFGFYLLAPVYTRWRNDKIFRDDPSTFFHPNFSIGTSISAAYHFKSKNPH